MLNKENKKARVDTVSVPIDSVNQKVESSQDLLSKAISLAQTEDYKNALKYFQKASVQGDPMATCILGDCYFYGAGVGENISRAIFYYEKSAKLGYPRACYVLAYFHTEGKYLAKNNSLATKYNQTARVKGYPHSPIYQDLFIVNKARDYLWDLALAGHGIGFAQCNVGVGFYTSELTTMATQYYWSASELKKDKNEKSYNWFLTASKNNESSSFYNLYLMIQSRQVKSISPDKAIDYLKRSSQLGYAQAQYSLGNKYFRGKGVERDLGEALRLFALADQGGSANATHRLGICYFYGKGVDIDYPSAFNYFKKATEIGYSPSICHLGYCYLKGLGVSADPKKGYSYFVEALGKGIVNAHAYLGDCYFEGLGVKKSYHSAFSQYLSAYKRGVLGVAERLAYCYENGLGTTKNPLEAKKIREAINKPSTKTTTTSTNAGLSYDTVVFDDTTEVITRVKIRSTK